VIHLWPDEEFSIPDGESYNHVALLVDAPIEEIADTLSDDGIEIKERNDAPKGARGWEPSLYIEDPVGYTVELKQHHRHADDPQ